MRYCDRDGTDRFPDARTFGFYPEKVRKRFRPHVGNVAAGHRQLTAAGMKKIHRGRAILTGIVRVTEKSVVEEIHVS